MPINNIHARYYHPHYARQQQQQSLTDPLAIPTVSGIQNTGAVASANPSETATGLLLSPSSSPVADSPVDGNGLPLVPGQSAITITTTPSSVSSTPSSSASSSTIAANNSNLNANSNNDGSNALSIGAVVGICVGVFLGLCCLLFLVIWWTRRRNKKMKNAGAGGGAGGGRGREGVDGSGGAGVKGGFSPLPDDIAAAGALGEKRIDKPTRPSRPTSPISPNSANTPPGSAAGHGRSILKPIPTLSPIQVSSISSVPPSYSYHVTNSASPVPSVSTDTGTSISIYSPSASMITGGNNNNFTTPLPAYESGNGNGFGSGNGNGLDARSANVNGYTITKPPPAHTNTNTNTYSPTSSSATHTTQLTNTSQKSHKTNYGGSLGLAHAFHDRTSLYTTHSSNGDHSYDADADADGSFLTLRSSDYDLSNKMKMTPEAKATPPISVLSDVEEREVGTPPVTPSYSVLVGNGAGIVRSDGDTYFSTKNSVNPFEDPSSSLSLPPLSSSPSMDLPRSPPPAITLTIPPTPNTASSAAPSYMSTSTTATMKHSHNRMESLLAALNIPLSPAGAEEDEV